MDCVKRWKEWGEAGGEGRVRGGLPLNCDQNTIMMESDVYDCNPSSFTILLCDCQGSACDWCDCEKIGGLQESWWISRANTFTGIGSKSHRFSSNCGVDHNFGAILTFGLKLLRSRRSPPDCGSLAGIAVCYCPDVRPGHNSGGIKPI